MTMMSGKQQPTVKHDEKEEARRILRRLQGEDGYDIFADRRPADDHNRRLREYEEERR